MRGVYMKNTIQTTLTLGMQQESTQKTCQTSTCSLEDFLAKLSVLLEKEEDSMTPEVRSFLRSQGFSRTKDPDIYYSKMYEVYFLTTREKLSRQYLGFSPTWGISFGGVCLTARIMESPRGEREYLLKDILEENVEEKYYLSEEMMRKILVE